MFSKLFKRTQQGSGKGKEHFQQDNESLQTEVKALRGINQQLRKELELSRKRKVRNHKLQRDYLLRNRNQLSADRDALKKSNQTLLTEIKNQNLQMAEAHKRLLEMQNEKKTLQQNSFAEKETLEIKIVQLRHEISKMVGAMDEKTQENQTLQKDLEQLLKNDGDEILRKNLQLRKQVPKIQSDLEKTAFLKANDQELREQTTRLHDNVRGLVSSENEFDLIKNKIKLLEHLIQKDLKGLQFFGMKLNAMQNKNKCLQNQTEEINVQNQKLRKEMQEMKFVKSTCDVSKKQVDLQQEENISFKEENEKVQKDLQEVKNFESTCDVMRKKGQITATRK
ncbi:trichohyalin-like [Melanotaenia boesemani]|uniref:trichohyalin-like n=1 Tax=Melanotaenia boesemani TaxID=1250792 RepID=UPI001C056BB0|nr:trichohyalin-like [Melanotaenia boesemani]